MKKGLTEIVFILDRSGSMEGLEADTIGGFNSMIEKQKDEEGDVIVSTVLFDDHSKVLHNRLDLKDVPTMTRKDYYVGGCTALLDAVGRAIDHIIKVRKYTREAEQPEKTMFIIATDGMENSRRMYGYEEVRRLIEQQKEKYGWEFLFLGANMDAVKEASRFGIAPERAVRYQCDKEGTRVVYHALANAVCSFRMHDEVDECWSDEVNADYKKRGKKLHK